jgi:thymidylate synthase (FAD)
VVKAVVPLAYDAFERHVLHGCRLSREEIKAVRNLIAGKETGLAARAEAEFREKLGL